MGNRYRPKGEVTLEKENIDPVYKYVDDKVKLIKRELQQLKVAHDAIANQHAREILNTQRALAWFKISSDVGAFRDIIQDQLHGNPSLFTQLIADATAAKSKLDTSQEPFSVLLQFTKKWSEILKNLGAEVISF